MKLIQEFCDLCGSRCFRPAVFQRTDKAFVPQNIPNLVVEQFLCEQCFVTKCPQTKEMTEEGECINPEKVGWIAYSEFAATVLNMPEMQHTATNIAKVVRELCSGCFRPLDNHPDDNTICTYRYVETTDGYQRVANEEHIHG